MSDEGTVVDLNKVQVELTLNGQTFMQGQVPVMVFGDGMELMKLGLGMFAEMASKLGLAVPSPGEVMQRHTGPLTDEELNPDDDKQDDELEAGDNQVGQELAEEPEQGGSGV